MHIKVMVLLNQLDLTGDKLISLTECLELFKVCFLCLFVLFVCLFPQDLCEAGWDGSMDVKLDDMTEADLKHITDGFVDQDLNRKVENAPKKVTQDLGWYSSLGVDTISKCNMFSQGQNFIRFIAIILFTVRFPL